MPVFNEQTFDEAADMIYENGAFDVSQLTDPKARNLITETARILNTAVEEHISHEVSDELRYALENNVFIFSGFKVYHSLSEVGLSLIDASGHIKPFEDFHRDVKAIKQSYYKNWLYAEYNHAVGSTLMAEKWQDLKKNSERYYLQYRTALDERVRDEHAALEGITLPADDPFWASYFPPNGWNCRCTAVKVRRAKYEMSDPDNAMRLGDSATDDVKQRIFRFNPGMEMKIFPPRHPYYKVPTTVATSISRVSKDELLAQHEQNIYDEQPSNLPEATRMAITKNILELEKKLKTVCGKPMNITEADRQSANPKWQPPYVPDVHGEHWFRGVRYRENIKGKAYRINCQTCTPAFLLRLRGLDIVAKGNTDGSLSEYLSKGRGFECWLNPDGTRAEYIQTKKWYQDKGYTSMDTKKYIEFIEENTKEVGIYGLCIGWKEKGGHMTVIQRRSDGLVVNIEPQYYNPSKGEFMEIYNVCNEGTEFPHECRGIMRIDDKIFDMKFASIFSKAKK